MSGLETLSLEMMSEVTHSPVSRDMVVGPGVVFLEVLATWRIVRM